MCKVAIQEQEFSPSGSAIIDLMPITPYIRKYFWDIDPQKARPKSHPEYYIKRLLELGDKKALQWLKTVFGKGEIRKVAKEAKLSRKSKAYWRVALK